MTFPYPNQKRLAVLARHHVAGAQVPGVDQVNRQENIVLPPTSVQPCVDFTATLDQVLTPSLLQAVPLYAEEQYVLLWAQGRGVVLLKEGAGARAYARAMWQAAWLHEAVEGTADAAMLGESLRAMRARCDVMGSDSRCSHHHCRFDSFWDAAVSSGWRMEDTIVPTGETRLVL